ncbi:DUF5689 domain-containing protein [Croceivirga sp. JEA036]|uniref:DUF5689 domain-containing protein n=1 Tax=Croceivirga sp. JEA036 TaxID=2721162 RepID=UPI00143B2FC4|nr:DUF5689 domain-containing protein [Croceivirga sp. JEA036]NJB36880.1 lamin tail domain-containing protein [Croceivirga sp. JEA036]
MHQKLLCLGFLVLFFLGCVVDKDFEAPEQNCLAPWKPNTTYEAVKGLYKGETVQILQDLVIEGYVTSSDQAGNFFSVLHFQDKPENPTDGMQLQLDVRATHLRYPPGSKITINLNDLYLGQSKGVYTLGGTFVAFGATSVGRLPALKVPEHLFVSCEQGAIIPNKLALKDIDSTKTNTLVQFENMEFDATLLDSTYAQPQVTVDRMLLNCQDETLMLKTSGFSDFSSAILPAGSGTITGVLLRERNDYFLVLRDTLDVQFTKERCAAVITEFTSDALFFTELADPNNNADARFIELYYAGNENLSLNKWSIQRYTNANTEVSSVIDLSEIVLEPNTFLIIAKNASEFERVYGFSPDMEAGSNSPADSNGDDNLFLVDPFGTVIDAFGVIGEDGTGTNHEFEDGKAIRNSNIIKANPIFSPEEWQVFNDSGSPDTVNSPQNAPEDFSPSQRD